MRELLIAMIQRASEKQLRMIYTYVLTIMTK